MFKRRTEVHPANDRNGGQRLLTGRRIHLRPLEEHDFEQWRLVRRRCADWLQKWEPRRIPGQPDTVEDRVAFATRCSIRAHEASTGVGFAFGIFADGQFIGEINISSVHRGPQQSAYVGYWIDESFAGQGFMPEAVVVVMEYAFEKLRLHRLQISIIPRNTASRRVVEKLGLRSEGVAVGYLEINGNWEDHIRYAITAEEWAERRDTFREDWIT